MISEFSWKNIMISKFFVYDFYGWRIRPKTPFYKKAVLNSKKINFTQNNTFQVFFTEVVKLLL